MQELLCLVSPNLFRSQGNPGRGINKRPTLCLMFVGTPVPMSDAFAAPVKERWLAGTWAAGSKNPRAQPLPFLRARTRQRPTRKRQMTMKKNSGIVLPLPRKIVG